MLLASKQGLYPIGLPLINMVIYHILEIEHIIYIEDINVFIDKYDNKAVVINKQLKLNVFRKANY